jgi:folate-dependent tRNA-U54 methylase TrmFO/GidA
VSVRPVPRLLPECPQNLVRAAAPVLQLYSESKFSWYRSRYDAEDSNVIELLTNGTAYSKFVNNEEHTCMRSTGNFMYHQFNIHNSTFSPHSVFMCFV